MTIIFGEMTTIISTAHPIRIAYHKIAEGWAYMRNEPSVGRIALAKAAWAIGGGATVYMLTLLGEEMMPGAQAAGISILFSGTSPRLPLYVPLAEPKAATRLPSARMLSSWI